MTYGKRISIKRPSPKPIQGKTQRVVEAEAIATEVKTWTCDTCDTMTEAGEKYCRSCKDYVDDLNSGMFDIDGAYYF